MEEDRHSYFESQTPPFFKIILHDTLQSGKLEVPKSFMRKHGSALCSNKVYLKVKSGDIWEMELYKENGDVWLHKGWQEFVEFYHIQFGYFLIFGYQGNYEFQVVIFGKSTLEIKYPLKPCNKSKQSDGDDPCLLPVDPEVIEISDSKMSVDNNACQINANKSAHCLKKGSGAVADGDGKNGELGTSKSLTGQNPLGDRDFVSPNQYIRVLMQSNRVNSCILHLPHWKTFAGDNNLMVGDVCVLELIDSVESNFQVSILRAAKDRISGGSSAEELLAPTRNHIAKNPSFKIFMTRYRMKFNSRVDLPRGFLKLLNETSKIAILEVAGRFWSVGLNYNPLTKRGVFADGWDTFMMDNSLQAGDVCELEFINMEPIVLKVTIHRCSL